MKRQDFGELLAEAVAVFIIIAFGDSVAAMYSLYNPSPYLNSYWGVCIAWGLAVTMGLPDPEELSPPPKSDDDPRRTTRRGR